MRGEGKWEFPVCARCEGLVGVPVGTGVCTCDPRSRKMGKTIQFVPKHQADALAEAARKALEQIEHRMECAGGLATEGNCPRCIATKALRAALAPFEGNPEDIAADNMGSVSNTETRKPGEGERTNG